MALHNEIGKRGEQLALNFLRNQGYQILETNWRYSRAEIDIIARKEGILVFVEVKTRTAAAFGPPEAFVSAKQERLIANAAAVYMEQIGHDWEIRFDIIGVLLSQSETSIKHFEDAFFPSW